MKKVKFFLAVLILLIGLPVSAIWIFNQVFDRPTYTLPWETTRTKTEIRAACQPHLREANQLADQVIARRGADFASYIESRKEGAKPFSKEVISPYGKWIVAKARLPFTDKEGHKKYVAETFGKHIFTNEDLASAVRQAVEGGVKDLEAIENNLAVALRREILGRTLASSETPIAAEEFKKAVDRLVIASQFDAAKAVGQLITSEVATQIGTQVLVRLGVSSGILAAGAINSWWTIGGSLFIGFLVNEIWNLVDDPAGDIEREVTIALDRLSSDGSGAIKAQMSESISVRSKAWSNRIEEMM